jgi:uncharacterized protein YdeI (YjbR/CyaY-like superfamily)
MLRTNVDDYLRDGCGRCPKFATPGCKVRRWREPLEALRALALDAGLAETLKWGCPCYTVDGRNVAMIAAFEGDCVISFFRGAALPDPAGVLVPAGPNSRLARTVRFRSVDDVEARRAAILGLLHAAIALERDGSRRVARAAPAEEPVPVELARRLAADAALGDAWRRLTPGRRRSHVLHVAGAKQAATRERRAERCASDILAGRGFGER